jgi:orotate phosphoribosyltransferase
MTQELDTGSTIEAIELGHLLYQKALVRREDEPITDPKGRPIGWLLDTRIPMLESSIFREVGRVLVEMLTERGISQVAGYGYGAFPVVSSVLGAAPNGSWRAGFIRESRKGHGRQRHIEGPIHASRSVVLLDDILNSGQSAEKAVTILTSEGFRVEGVLTLFNFTWGGGRDRLQDAGLWVSSLLDINLREPTSSSDSDGSSPA